LYFILIVKLFSSANRLMIGSIDSFSDPEMIVRLLLLSLQNGKKKRKKQNKKIPREIFFAILSI